MWTRLIFARPHSFWVWPTIALLLSPGGSVRAFGTTFGFSSAPPPAVLKGARVLRTGKALAMGKTNGLVVDRPRLDAFWQRRFATLGAALLATFALATLAGVRRSFSDGEVCLPRSFKAFLATLFALALAFFFAAASFWAADFPAPVAGQSACEASAPAEPRFWPFSGMRKVGYISERPGAVKARQASVLTSPETAREKFWSLVSVSASAAFMADCQSIAVAPPPMSSILFMSLAWSSRIAKSYWSTCPI